MGWYLDLGFLHFGCLVFLGILKGIMDLGILDLGIMYFRC